MFVVFALAGVGFATWVSRIPLIRDHLGVSTAGMAVLLFGLSAGAVLGLTLAPLVHHWLGSRRGLLVSLIGVAGALVLIGVTADVFRVAVLALCALVVFGFFYGTTDVLINVEGAAVEREFGRTSLPLMNAFFSMGTAAGAGIGAAASAFGVSVVLDFTVIAAVIVLSAVVAARSIARPHPEGQDVHDDVDEPGKERARSSALGNVAGMFRDGRLLLIGLMAVGAALAEGGPNARKALAPPDGHGFSNTAGALVYGTFVAAMTVTRIVSGPAIDRLGRFPVLAASAVVGLVGLVVFITVQTPWVVFVAAALWGVGASLIFPVGVSVAADHPTRSAHRVAFISMFGYAAFLIGPPVIGILGEHIGILEALWFVAIMLLLSLIAMPAIRNKRTARRRS